tara:strand:- start:88 stop:495 length:408 start_codon:yes stop_codon:yes gene_type:complete
MNDITDFTCHIATHEVGFRDGGYFQVESKGKDNSNKYKAYWLTDYEGNRAPDKVYQMIDDKLVASLAGGWQSVNTKADHYRSIIMCCDEIGETCVGYWVDEDVFLVLVGLDCLKDKDTKDDLFINKDFVSTWRYL